MASYWIPLLGGTRETLEGKEQLFALETVLDFSLTAFLQHPLNQRYSTNLEAAVGTYPLLRGVSPSSARLFL